MGLIVNVLFCLNASIALAQVRVSTIDFFGYRGISLKELRNAAGKIDGIQTERDLDSLQSRVARVPGVAWVKINRVCCQGNGENVFLSIGASTGNFLPLRPMPRKALVLPEKLSSAYLQYLTMLTKAVQAGISGDDLSRGYSVMDDREVSLIQLALPKLTEDFQSEISGVLLGSTYEKQREAAAFLLGYCPDRARSIKVFAKALNDPSPVVRNNVLRSMAAVLYFKQREVNARVRWSQIRKIVAMVKSNVWSDRDKAVFALTVLTENRDRKVLDQIRSAVQDELKEMAGWNSRAHALLGCIVLGRIQGLSEQQIFESWKNEVNED
ncbi:MAG: HEAT repeat domain-containing protein [Pedobacter sp.]|nr:MAG: HEAT repeat domain-containing protein [Pedobacter sp.]